MTEIVYHTPCFNHAPVLFAPSIDNYTTFYIICLVTNYPDDHLYGPKDNLSLPAPCSYNGLASVYILNYCDSQSTPGLSLGDISA